MIRSTTVTFVLKDPVFSHLSIPSTSVLYKVEGTQYKLCCVSKLDYRCDAVEPLSPFPFDPGFSLNSDENILKTRELEKSREDS